MAKFEKAIPIILQHEGGYSNHARDKGGETYRGISRVYFPNWSGWPVVDAAKPLKTGAIIKSLEPVVMDWYKAEKWNKAKGDLIKKQEIANFVFDSIVNHGQGGKVIQNGINSAIEAEKLPTKKISVDNKIGPETLTALNTYPTKIYPYLIKQRELYYRSLNDFDVFGRGWLSRLNKFPTSLSAIGGAGFLIVGLAFLLLKK